ncbi:MAG TPA: hypothetical protein DEQ28_03450 [Clostridiales bacterium]|nr:hypothetical protein [Clostridiales bacterium]
MRATAMGQWGPVKRMWTCPACGARGVGCLGVGQYYCRECCIEFESTDRGWQLFRVGDEGELIFWKEVAHVPGRARLSQGGVGR